MTRFLLAILLLPLAFAAGCVEPTCDGAECVEDPACTDCGGDDDDSVDVFNGATLRNIAPYGWIGSTNLALVDEFPDTVCEDVNVCDYPVEETGNYFVATFGETFICVPQTQLVTESDDGNVVSVDDAWTGEGVCGLAPNGEYSGWDVDTDIGSLNGFDQVWITVDNYMAVITGSDFFYEDDEYLLEGWVSDDLNEVYFHRVLETGEYEQTIYLE
ncbi:hypothetical protein HY630_01510 [Candidatus Uhrbacteria bacterium]|nr:hypothetical protein [Candidatus Uhrbacteria bacterium]